MRHALIAVALCAWLAGPAWAVRPDPISPGNIDNPTGQINVEVLNSADQNTLPTPATNYQRWIGNTPSVAVPTPKAKECVFGDTGGGTTTTAFNLNCTNGLTIGTGTSSPTFTGALSGNATTATALAGDPADCGANTWATSINASGTLGCAAVTYAGITAMTSANLASIITDETGGSGVAVFGTSPTISTSIIGGTQPLVMKPGSNSTTAIQWANATGTPGVTYDSTNNSLGIGTTTPDAFLTVGGNYRTVTDVFGTAANTMTRFKNVYTLDAVRQGSVLAELSLEPIAVTSDFDTAALRVNAVIPLSIAKTFTANSTMRGIYAEARNQGHSTFGKLIASQVSVRSTSDAVIASSYGLLAGVINNSTGTITSTYFVYLQQPTGAAGATFGNIYGLYIEDMKATGTLTNPPEAIHINSQTATGAFAINQAGSGINAFAGNVGIGTTSPDVLLDISSTAPTLQLEDTTASAKSLNIAVDTNIADFREKAGASGSLLALDLANNRVGIGTAAPSYLVGLGGGVARQIGMEINPTPSTATGSGGFNLTLNAGGANPTPTGTPDRNGGTLILAGGAATGAGNSQVQLMYAQPGTPGTTAATPRIGAQLAISTPGPASVWVANNTYGGIYRAVSGTPTPITVPTANVGAKVTTLNTASGASDTTVDTANAKITATRAGTYRICFGVSFLGANSAQVQVEARRAVTPIPNLSIFKVLPASVGSVTEVGHACGFVALAANEDVELYVTSNSNGDTVRFDRAGLNIERVGD